MSNQVLSSTDKNEHPKLLLSLVFKWDISVEIM